MRATGGVPGETKVEAVKTVKTIKVETVKKVITVKTVKAVKIVKTVKTVKAVKTVESDGKRTRRDISPKKSPVRLPAYAYLGQDSEASQDS